MTTTANPTVKNLETEDGTQRNKRGESGRRMIDICQVKIRWCETSNAEESLVL